MSLNINGYKTLSANTKSGFTIVELLIVIVVIAILAAVTVVGFNGVQRRANEATAATDLRNVSLALETIYLDAGSYPTSLPTSFKTSPKISLNLKDAPSGSVRYDGMTSTQNAVLFQDTCLATIAAGWGLKEDQPSNSYFTDCIVQERTQLRLNGWNAGKYVTAPVTVAKLDSHVASYAGGNIPLYVQKATIFMTKWKELFQAQGGSFPVAGFWDPWATSVNGGVMKPSLPTPTVVGSASDNSMYCIEARHSSDANLIMHITKGESIKNGACT